MPVAQAQRGHDAHDHQHRDDAYCESHEQLASKPSPGNPVTQADTVAQTHARRQDQEADQPHQHGDALADAVKREVEVRMQQQPGRVGEHADRRQCDEDETEKQGERAHVVSVGRVSVRLH